MGNTIKYGLKNVHYAVITNKDGVITYGKTVEIPGAVNLSVTPKGDKTEFYADDVAYFVASSNQGYEGNLEVAIVPDSFKKEVLGWTADASGALFENANILSKNIALLFEFDGDVNAVRHILYNVSVARPAIESSTQGASIEVKTESFDITASPRLDGFVKAKAEPADTSYAKWFEAVHEYTAI
jgi:phi13 family phage major tail protein